MAAATRRSNPPLLVVFDGQSFNVVPPWEGSILGRSYPYRLLHDMDQYDLGRPRYGIPGTVPAISGQSWTDLAATVETRIYPLAASATRTALVMCGGTTDINTGDSGATLYADHVSYADGCRAAGFDIIIATTLLGSTSFTGGEITARTDFNTLLLADAEDAFDGIADVDAAFVALYGAAYWDETPPFFDGVHMYGESCAEFARVVGPVLWPLIEALPMARAEPARAGGYSHLADGV